MNRTAITLQGIINSWLFGACLSTVQTFLRGEEVQRSLKVQEVDTESGDIVSENLHYYTLRLLKIELSSMKVLLKMQDGHMLCLLSDQVKVRVFHTAATPDAEKDLVPQEADFLRYMADDEPTCDWWHYGTFDRASFLDHCSQITVIRRSPKAFLEERLHILAMFADGLPKAKDLRQ